MCSRVKVVQSGKLFSLQCDAMNNTCFSLLRITIIKIAIVGRKDKNPVCG